VRDLLVHGARMSTKSITGQIPSEPTRGAALQKLLKEGAQARAQRRADAQAARRLREAFAVEPSRLAGFPDDADVDALMLETRAE
jgi:hypothetical protein